ncbi:putative membrane protein (TIGR04086 family) [Natronobacillus azotifigens]|uniref:TIGR04086 family membrane protein n=1 Tax=Natronobacillus azotifigens TaxID=472978 RepID=A0A9J6RA04_9BACI|nr:TIGR04086 family membrane protein [Natronobacillus azotifigens]MCZ0702367.1 TIGR04086 family membrane protein [Natronobacillus azotifigens]
MKNRSTALLYGWITILALLIVASLFFAVLLRFTSISESTIRLFTTLTGLLILLIGALVAGVKAKEKGWIIGVVISLGFSLFIYLYQYLGYQQHFTVEQLLYHGGFLLASILGAVIGVNIGDKQQT